MTAVLLALCASLGWGLADFGAGFSSRRLPVLVVALAMQLSGLVLAGVVVLATGARPPSWTQAGWAVFAGLTGLVGLAAFYRGLSVGTMGVVGPLASTAAFVPFGYGLAGGERPSASQLAGVLLAIVGVVGASLEPLPPATAEGGRGVPAGRRRLGRLRFQPLGRGRRVGAGVGLALVAAAGFGWSLVGLDRAAPGGAAWAALIMRIAAVPCFALLLAATGGARPPRRLLPLLAGVGVCDAGANLLFALAATRGLLSVVSVLASLYPVVILALARVVLHERVARPQLAGVAVALAGVALVSAG